MTFYINVYQLHNNRQYHGYPYQEKEAADITLDNIRAENFYDLTVGRRYTVTPAYRIVVRMK